MIIGAALIPFIKGDLKKYYALLLPLLALLSIITMKQGTFGVVELLGNELIFGRVDKLAMFFAFFLALSAFAMVLYGLHAGKDSHYITAMIYPGGSLGVVFAGDLITLLIFSEFMAFSSVFFVLQGKTRAATKAAYRYILVHATSGICVMGGMILIYGDTGSYAFNQMGAMSFATGLVLLGFLINAAVPPFGAWCPDAYPRSSVFGGVFLCAFTTKTSVYCLIRGFAGTDFLIWVGAIIAVYAVVYAILENDMRKLLSHHIISQVGFMVCAIGIGTHLAINGAASHAIANVIYKGLLFMGAGAIIHMTGKRKLTEMGGLYKKMPYTFILFMIGAFSIAATPFTLGFVSKSIILTAAAEEHLMWPWILMELASTGTFLSITLKLGYFAFFAKDQGLEAKDPPKAMLYGMAIPAFLCIFLGLFPGVMYKMLPFAMDYVPYTFDHVIWLFQMQLFIVLVFFGFLKVAAPKSKLALDTDWFYRRGGQLFMCFAYRVVLVIDEAVSNAYSTVLLKATKVVAAISLTFDTNFVDGFVNGVANTVVRAGGRMRRLQTGQLQQYAVVIVVGVVILINILLFYR
jgi:multicomponent Na+:H+ antiporter subunit D